MGRAGGVRPAGPQRAMVAARLATMGRGRPGENASNEAISQDEAAALLNVSRSAVQRATVVRDEAVPELVRAVEEGRASVSAASHIASLPLSTSGSRPANLPLCSPSTAS